MIYTLQYTQPDIEVPSENWLKRQLHVTGGSGKHVVRAKLTPWKEVSWYAWKQQRYGPVGAVLGQPCDVQVVLGFHTNRRRDPHNYIGTVVKSLIDGLVLAGVWPDDNPEYVTVLEPQCKVHTGMTGRALPGAIILQPREQPQ